MHFNFSVELCLISQKSRSLAQYTVLAYVLEKSHDLDR